LTRLPAVVFAALVAATVGAFFLTQHLKVSLPLIGGGPWSVPSAINPVSGGVCEYHGKPTHFDRTWISFWLPNSDTVSAYIFNAAGQTVDTVSERRRMTAHARGGRFYWFGTQSSGGYAPDGTYYWAFVLDRENRTVELTSDPIRVITTSPHPRVTNVSVTGANPARGAGGSASTGPAIITPPRQSVTIHFTPGDYRSAAIMLWRTDTGKPRLVKQYPVPHPRLGVARWNGLIHGHPAPAGTYMVGLQVQDQACNQGTFPTAQPPVIPEPGTGVTVRYLAAQPPLGPVAAGSIATVYVDSRLRPYTWALRIAGLPKAIAHGHQPGRAYVLHVRLPAGAAGLYDLTIDSANHSTSVPLIAAATSGADASARVLVVLPMLTWQGENPVDDNGWGLPDTLTAGDRIALQRPLVDGLPAGFADQAALLRYLRASHQSFQLTTDVALALPGLHPGPGLSGHRGVILDGAFFWLPAVLVSRLTGYVRTGGRLLSIGAGSLQGLAPLHLRGRALTAGPPAPLSPDPFGAEHGAVSTTAGELIAAQSDPLGIFAPAMAVTGFRDFQTITPPRGVAASIGGVAAAAPTIVGFRSGKGAVVEVGLPGFASSLRRNVGSQQLLGRIWNLLSS
jgi:hypothetical protein